MRPQPQRITEHASWRTASGLSLLEVMLSLAILGGALALVGELVRLGARNAEAARDLATAQRLCESKMAELAAGLEMAQAVSSVPLEEMGEQEEWLYSIQVEQIEQEGMLAVWVIVEQNSTLFPRPVSFSLVRWMIDPEAQVLEESTQSSGTTSSATSTQSM